MINKVKNTIKKYQLIEPNDTIVIALSGGIDSMVLFDVIYRLKDEFNLSIVIAHVNHNVREESKDEYSTIMKFAKDKNIPFHGLVLDNNYQDNFHQYSHHKRYEFFSKISKKYDNSKIALAHHALDQVETILMRINRGSSFKGYAGILPISLYQNQVIIRPLIETSKEEIINYQHVNKINFLLDKSNLSDKYTRNRYRKHIIPLLKKENDNLHIQFQQFSKYIYESDKLIQHMTDEYYKKNWKNDYLDITTFNEQFYMIKITVLLRIINMISNNSIEVSNKILENLIKMCKSNKPHLELNLSNCFTIKKVYDKLYFNKDIAYVSYKLKIDNFGLYTLPNKGKIELVKDISIYNSINSHFLYELCYNGNDIFPLFVRTRENGDKIKFSFGTKKLKDVLINKKIPMDVRNNLAIITDKNNNILWIPRLNIKINNLNENIDISNNKIYIIYREE